MNFCKINLNVKKKNKKKLNIKHDYSQLTPKCHVDHVAAEGDGAGPAAVHWVPLLLGGILHRLHINFSYHVLTSYIILQNKIKII